MIRATSCTYTYANDKIDARATRTSAPLHINLDGRPPTSSAIHQSLLSLIVEDIISAFPQCYDRHRFWPKFWMSLNQWTRQAVLYRSTAWAQFCETGSHLQV